MKMNYITSLALAGLALPVVAQADTKPCCQPGALLQKMDLLNPACDAPAYKVKANQKTGTQWHVDMAYGVYTLHRSEFRGFSEHVAPNYALIHGHLNQRIIQDDVNGGTWLHAEFIGSWGLEKDAVEAAKGNPLGSVTAYHRDLVGPRDFYFPEISVKHFFNGKKAAIVAGMVKFGDYFDAVGIAGDTYTSFMNSGFCNSTVLPLIDSNVGALAQVQIGKNNYVMAGVTRTGTAPGYDPVNSDGTGYTVMGEWGHYFNEGKGVVKITPFFTMLDVDMYDEDDPSAGSEHHRNAGVVSSVQYTINDSLTVFVRGGVAAKQEYGNAAELTGGLRAKLIPSRKDDYLGIAYGVFKGRNYAGWVNDEDGDASPAADNYHCRETVLEAYYNLQLCRYFRVMPHIQYIHDPAYSDNNDSVVFGIQGVFSF